MLALRDIVVAHCALIPISTKCPGKNRSDRRASPRASGCRATRPRLRLLRPVDVPDLLRAPLQCGDVYAGYLPMALAAGRYLYSCTCGFTSKLTSGRRGGLITPFCKAFRKFWCPNPFHGVSRGEGHRRADGVSCRRRWRARGAVGFLCGSCAPFRSWRFARP